MNDLEFEKSRIQMEAFLDTESIVGWSPDEPASETRKKFSRPTVIQKTEARNAALRLASVDEVYDVAISLGLNETQAAILRAVLGEKPHFSNIAKIIGVSSETVFNWARVLGVRSKGREQLRPKLSEAQEKAIGDVLGRAKDESVGPNLTALSRDIGISITTLKTRAKDHGISGGGKYSIKPKPKHDAVLNALTGLTGPINQADLARKLGVNEALIYRIRRKEIENDPGTQKGQSRSRPKELTFEGRRNVLTVLAEGNHLYEDIAQRTGYPRATICRIAQDYGIPSRRASVKSVNVELFLDAAELIIKRRLASAPHYEITAIVERYLEVLPRGNIKEIAAKYSDLPWDDFPASRVARYFDRLSDSQVKLIISGRLAPERAEATLASAALHFAALPAEIARQVIARRLNTLPRPVIDEVALNYFELSPRYETRRVIRKSLRREYSCKSEGLVVSLEGIRPWATSRTFLDAALSYYLAEAGITDAQELQSRTDGKIIRIDLPPDLYMSMQYAFVARGTILNRRNIHRREGNRGGALAPDRARLERLAKLAVG